jgi:hypothetical protein
MRREAQKVSPIIVSSCVVALAIFVYVGVSIIRLADNRIATPIGWFMVAMAFA